MGANDGWDWDGALLEMSDRWTEVADEMFSFANEMRNNQCQTVYDLGCGVGRHTVFLAQQDFELVSMVHKQELAVAGNSERQRAHWLIRAQKPQR